MANNLLPRLILPAGLTLVGTAAYLLPNSTWGRAWAPAWTPAGIDAVGVALASIGGTFLVLRLIDRFVWHGWMQRQGQSAPPRLLTDLFAALVMLAVVMALLAGLFGVPLGSILATSGVLVAVLGFALRDMLASLFSGIALNIEHPFIIGDWIGLETGEVGQVIEVSWLTTHLRSKDRVVIVVPNAELAARRFRNYGHKGQAFRTEVDIVLDHALPPERVERILLTAAHAVPDAVATGREPDIKIREFTDRGTAWIVRFWLDDYDALVDTRYKVQRSIQHQLRLAGIHQPYRIVDSYQATMPERHLDLDRHKTQVIARVELFRTLDLEHLQKLCATALERHVSIGTILVEEGEEGRSLFIVLEGFLEVSIEAKGANKGVGKSNGRITVNRLAAGAFFGEFSLLTGAPRSARVEAKSECVLLEITEEALTPVLQSCPELADHLARVLANRQQLTDKARGGMRTAPSGNAHEEARFLRRIRSLFGV